jgi:hypothetical protein
MGIIILRWSRRMGMTMRCAWRRHGSIAGWSRHKGRLRGNYVFALAEMGPELVFSFESFVCLSENSS